MHRKQGTLAGWGGAESHAGPIARPRSVEAIRACLAGGGVIARGLGRSYGDSAVGARLTLDMTAMNRMRCFEAGALEAEAGVSIADVIETFLPLGWFPHVTPGTKHVTLGGAFAADVHGKNHHVEGSFADHVDWIEVMGPDGGVSRAGPGEEAFEAARGAMGLSGVILALRLRLRPVESAWIVTETRAAAGLSHAMAALRDDAGWPYSVAWIDCLDPAGRALALLGRHARPADLPPGRGAFDVPKRRQRAVPFALPGFALNRWSMRAFNAAYYWAGARKRGPHLTDWDRYFYPLDALAHWPRIYGAQGFYQFQCVLPEETAEAGLQEMLRTTAKAGQGSFLAVLKRMGPQAGARSFPMPGFTLALDFPARHAAMVDRLSAIALDRGGRFYLAKDARLDAAGFGRSDPRWARGADARAAFASKQSERLGL